MEMYHIVWVLGIGLTWTMRPMTMTMATQDTISAWFWMMNSWLRMGKFLLAADFLPLIGAIFKNIAMQRVDAVRWMPRKCVFNTRLKLYVKRDYKIVYDAGGWSSNGLHWESNLRCRWHLSTECVAVALAVYRLLMCQYTKVYTLHLSACVYMFDCDNSTQC